jgi:hypothetical protein
VNFERDFNQFKRDLLLHSIQRPPYSIKIFGLKEMTLISDYVVNTYFRHYLMYKYAFTKKMRLEFVIENFMPVPEPVVEEVVVQVPVVPEPVEVVPVVQEVPIVEPIVEQVVEEVKEPVLPVPIKSPKHEAAIQDLKVFIQSVLKTKLDEIKVSVNQKIATQEEQPKREEKKSARKK